MSQFRKDIVSGEWIIVAPERARRPSDFLARKTPRQATPKDTCPFEDLKKTGNWPPYIAKPSMESWNVAIIPNKYPALHHAEACPTVLKEDLYERAEGIGYHDLLVFKDHEIELPDMSNNVLEEAFLALQERYRQVESDPCLVYTSTFFNWGNSAGASLYHPHFQIVTLPIIPPDILHSLAHSSGYFENNHTCVHCKVIEHEINNKVRLIAENDGAIAITPFASRQPFDIEIYPKTHFPHFEDTPILALRDVVAILKKCLEEIREHLNDPDLNFFIHTSPLKNKEIYSHYHWHMEIIPKLSVAAGFELSTGVLINVVEPEVAAAMLRGDKVHEGSGDGWMVMKS